MESLSYKERNHRAMMALFALMLFFTLFLIMLKSKAQAVISDTLATRMIERQEMIDEALEL